jgi:hypothetical protein
VASAIVGRGDMSAACCVCAASQTMLSMMLNPAAPVLMCVSEEDHRAAQRYRLYTIFRLPGLQFLDAAPVTAAEREEARRQVRVLAARVPIRWCNADVRGIRVRRTARSSVWCMVGAAHPFVVAACSVQWVLCV